MCVYLYTIKNLNNMKTETKYNYDFKNYKVKVAFQKLALDKGITLQELIAEALKLKYPQIKN